MKTLILILSFLLICSILFAQSVVSTSGNTKTVNSVSLSWTIGQPITSSLTKNNLFLIQGFQQPNIKIINEVNQLEDDLSFTIDVYPNPAIDFINLKVNKVDNTFYALFDLSGKLIEKKLVTNELTEITFCKLKPSTYILKVFNNKDNKTFKVVKQ